MNRVALVKSISHRPSPSIRYPLKYDTLIFRQIGGPGTRLPPKSEFQAKRLIFQGCDKNFTFFSLMNLEKFKGVENIWLNTAVADPGLLFRLHRLKPITFYIRREIEDEIPSELVDYIPGGPGFYPVDQDSLRKYIQELGDRAEIIDL